VRGLARLLRRNPTDAERILWQALTRDRRFAGQFKRQTPVGRHIPDFVSFVHRIAIELVNPAESDAIVADRTARQTWLEARDYRVIEMRVADVERDLAGELLALENLMAKPPAI
jgi:tRNA/rRNA methyltransferase